MSGLLATPHLPEATHRRPRSRLQHKQFRQPGQEPLWRRQSGREPAFRPDKDVMPLLREVGGGSLSETLRTRV
jgi:hypothetical protein